MPVEALKSSLPSRSPTCSKPLAAKALRTPSRSVASDPRIPRYMNPNHGYANARSARVGNRNFDRVEPFISNEM